MRNNGDNCYNRPKNGVLKAAQLTKLEQIMTNGNSDAAKGSRKLQEPAIKHLKGSLMPSDV
jgi:hypothetical protein